MIYSNLQQALQQRTLTIYNGTGHEVKWYEIDPNCRFPKYDINVNNCYSPLTLLRMMPLSVHKPISEKKAYADVPFNYRQYDIIIVSRKYFGLLKKYNLISMMDPDYLDRLYFLKFVYDHQTIVGARDFEKAQPCKTPYEYSENLRNNCIPSLYALFQATYLTRYCDIIDLLRRNELEQRFINLSLYVQSLRSQMVSLTSWKASPRLLL